MVTVLGVLLLNQFNNTFNTLTQESIESSTKHLRNQIDKRGQVITRFLSENLVNPLYRYDMEAIFELIQNVKTQTDIEYVYVIDTQGKIVHDGSDNLAGLEKSISNPAILKTLQENGEIFSEIKSGSKLFAMPIWIGDEPIGGVLIAISLDTVTEDINSLKTRMKKIVTDTQQLNTTIVIITIIVLAVLAMLSSIIIAKHLVNPIKQLKNQINLIKDGKYGVTVSTQHTDELGELLQSFNDMSLDLEHTTVSKQYMDNIFDSMSDTLVVIRPDYVIELVNSALCRLLGYDKNELIGQPFNVLFGKDEFNEVVSWINNIINEGEIIAQNKTYIAKDGSDKSVSFSASGMIDGNNTLTHVICVAQDNSDRIKMQDKLMAAKVEAETANNAKSEFLSRMSHELRTPMNSVLGFAQLLEYDRQNLTDNQIKYIKYILDSGKHLLNLINEVLDITKVDSSRMTVSIKDVSLEQVIESSISLVRPLADENNVTISVLSGENCNVQADEYRLKQVLVNLLSNAVKYNYEGGTVDISVMPIRDDDLRINIVDSGIGIRAKDKERIFEPFMRADSSTLHMEGTGLGLTICKKLITLMNGNIGFNSEHGKGSTFWIEIPQATSLIEPNNEQLSSYPDKIKQLKKLKILCVEDNDYNRVLIEKMLKEIIDCEISSAVNAEDGIKMAIEEQPDLILMDIQLPGMNGFDALDVLKANIDTSHIPVVAVSAHAMAEHVDKGKYSDFYYYLTKPINMKKLLKLIYTITEEYNFD